MIKKLSKKQRLYLKDNFLSNLIKKTIEIAGSQRAASRKLKIPFSTINYYLKGKIQSINSNYFNKILKFLQKHNSPVDVDAVIEKIEYDKEYAKRTIEKARKALYEKYGERTNKILLELSHKALKEKYGKDFLKILSNLGNKRLLEKYGKDAFKIITSKGFNALENKYGKNWRSVIGKLSYESRRKRWQTYSRRPVGIVYRREKLTEQEDEIVNLLKKANIEHQVHVMLEGYYECDIVIPNIDKPRICLEVSNTSPQASNLYRKIAQIFVRKMLLPKCMFILIIPESKRGKQIWHSRPDIIQFLLDESVMVFWTTETDKLINFIHTVLINKDCTAFFKEKYRWCKEHFEERRKHALSNAQKEVTKIPKSEKDVIEKLNLIGKKEVIFNKYNWPMVVDLVNGKALYEITTTSNHSALETISGRIFYLSKTLNGYELNLILYTNKDFPTKELIENFCKIIVIN